MKTKYHRAVGYVLLFGLSVICIRLQMHLSESNRFEHVPERVSKTSHHLPANPDAMTIVHEEGAFLVRVDNPADIIGETTADSIIPSAGYLKRKVELKPPESPVKTVRPDRNLGYFCKVLIRDAGASLFQKVFQSWRP